MVRSALDGTLENQFRSRVEENHPGQSKERHYSGPIPSYKLGKVPMKSQADSPARQESAERSYLDLLLKIRAIAWLTDHTKRPWSTLATIT
jgi:hypothetical protein